MIKELTIEKTGLPVGWVSKLLGEISVVSAGNSAPQKKELFTNGTFPFIRTSDVGKIKKGQIQSSLDNLNDEGIKKLRLFKKGTILFPKSGASTFLNHRVIMMIDGYVSSHLATIKPDDSCDDKYLWYFLILIDAKDLMQDIAYPSLKLSDIKNIPIAIPALPQQKKIVAILDKAFAAIDTAKANAELNLQNAKELFESYLQNIFENKGDDWVESSFGETFKLKSGEGLTAKNMIAGQYSVYGGNGIVGHHNDYNSENEVIIGRVGALCGNVRFISESFWLTDNAFRISLGLNNFNNDFVVYMLNHKNLRSYARQAAQPVISNSSLKDVIIDYPNSIEKQEIIVQKLDALSTECKKIEAIYTQKIADLEEMKKSVLQKAFSGQLNTIN